MTNVTINYGVGSTVAFARSAVVAGGSPQSLAIHNVTVFPNTVVTASGFDAPADPTATYTAFP